MQGQETTCSGLCCDLSQTITSEEIKYANLSVHTASNNTKVEQRKRFYLPAEQSEDPVFLVRSHLNCSTWQLQRLHAYFWWLNVIRHSSTLWLMLHTMTLPVQSPDRRCQSSRNRHFTALLWASIVLWKMGHSWTTYGKTEMFHQLQTTQSVLYLIFHKCFSPGGVLHFPCPIF